MTSIMLLAAAVLWGCGDNINDDNDNGADNGTIAYNDDDTDDPNGEGSLTIFPLNSEGEEIAGEVVLATTDDTIYEGVAGQPMRLPAPETYRAHYGGLIGCDGQMTDGSLMARSVEVTLDKKENVEIELDTFPYHEWDGQFECTFWDDYGWSDTWVVDYTNQEEGTTCIDKNGMLPFSDGEAILFTEDELTTDEGGTISDLEMSSEGLSLTWNINGENDIVYGNCIVTN